MKTINMETISESKTDRTQEPQSFCVSEVEAATRAEDRQLRNARILALLDTFDEGDPRQQREELEELQAGLEAARSGQRCLFSEGFNT